MGRRGENIRKRADGRWEARVVWGAPVGGKTRYKYLYGQTYQEVRLRKNGFLRAMDGDGKKKEAWEPEAVGRQESGERLFREIALEWLTQKQPAVKESTFAYYTVMLHNHLLGEWGGLPAADITSDQIAEFLRAKKAHGRMDGGELSDKTVSDLKGMLVQIFAYAKSRRWIDTVPAVPAVPVRQPAVPVLTRPEQERVERVLLEEDTPFSLGVLLSLYAGSRIGEVCALRWEDFDFSNETVRISRTLSRITNVDHSSRSKTKVVVGSPKTECSVRTIPLPASVSRYFWERRRDGPVYLMTGTEKFMEPRVCLDRFKRLLRRAGVPDHSYHTLRHTFATRCVESGVDVKSLSEIMGHSNVKITMQRYVHPSLDLKREQINKLRCFQAGGQNRGQ